MRNLSVHDTLKHIKAPHCLYCGTNVHTRSALAPHIGNCKVLAEYRIDVAHMKAERDLAWQRLIEVETALGLANIRITSLDAQISKHLAEKAASEVK
ncbi:MAG: hypothetical protein O3C69_04030 [Chloroflexi bacterium]|nr:hypothetical protein [Chloroflexota bacterium]